MVRVVLDTNVIVSALLSPRGTPGRILERLLDGAFELILSPSLLEELKRSLGYPRVKRYLRLSADEVETLLAQLETIGDPVQGVVELSAELWDRKDLPVLAAAVEGRAEYVVTGDNDLLVLEQFEGIAIVPPKAFLEVLGG